MVQLLKSSNKKSFLSVLVILLVCIFFIECGTASKNISSKQSQSRLVVFGDSILKTGIIIYDSKNKSARLLESDSVSIDNLTKRKLNDFFDSAGYIILLRESIKYSYKPRRLSLTLCKGKEIIIVSEKLLYNRYAVIKVKKFMFYEVINENQDSKKRLVFCKDD